MMGNESNDVMRIRIIDQIRIASFCGVFYVLEPDFAGRTSAPFLGEPHLVLDI
jgi:hypothetical protein